MQPTTVITVAETAPVYRNERDETRTIHVNTDGNGRYFYLPDHIGDLVMTEHGYRQVIEVTDHACTGLSGCGGVCGGDHLSDECCVEEIDLSDYREE